MQRVTFAVLTLAASALTQGVPYDEAIWSVFNNLAPSQGLWLANRNGTCTPITGLLAAGSAGDGVNAVQIDPIDDRIWLGGISSGGNTNGQVNWIRITGTTVTQFSQHATVAGASSVSGITFDDNGNPIVTSGAATGGVFRIDRATGGAGTLLANIPSGTHNAICRDPTGNLYVGMTAPGQVFIMQKNPDCSYQAPVLLGTVPVATVSGVAWCPPSGTSPAQIVVTTFGTTGNSIFAIPAAGGPATLFVNTLPPGNWVEYDPRHDDFLVVSAGPDPDTVSTMTRSGTPALLCSFGSIGLPSSIDVCGARDADVRAVPMCLNNSTTAFDLEMSVKCPPGQLGFIGLTQPFGALFGFGVAGPSGKVTVTLRNLRAPGPTPPGVFTFVAACVDPVNGALTVGQLLPWPSN